MKLPDLLSALSPESSLLKKLHHMVDSPNKQLLISVLSGDSSRVEKLFLHIWEMESLLSPEWRGVPAPVGKGFYSDITVGVDCVPIVLFLNSLWSDEMGRRGWIPSEGERSPIVSDTVAAALSKSNWDLADRLSDENVMSSRDVGNIVSKISKSGNVNAVAWLFDKGLDFEMDRSSLFVDAADSLNFKMMRYLLSGKGADPCVNDFCSLRTFLSKIPTLRDITEDSLKEKSRWFLNVVNTERAGRELPSDILLESLYLPTSLRKDVISELLKWSEPSFDKLSVEQEQKDRCVKHALQKGKFDGVLELCSAGYDLFSFNPHCLMWVMKGGEDNLREFMSLWVVPHDVLERTLSDCTDGFVRENAAAVAMLRSEVEMGRFRNKGSLSSSDVRRRGAGL